MPDNFTMRLNVPKNVAPDTFLNGIQDQLHQMIGLPVHTLSKTIAPKTSSHPSQVVIEFQAPRGTAIIQQTKRVRKMLNAKFYAGASL